MTTAGQAERTPAAAPSFALCFGILAAVTLVRLAGLYFSVVDLHRDEAQYWFWSRELDFGYFSKPPLLAWIIAVAERVCGDSEACIRAPAPLIHLGTSLVTYLVARELYDARVAFWAALAFGLAPATALSARIMSTDVPLMLFWALAMLAYVKLLRRADYRWALVLGAALGLGLLAKYAMVYFVMCVAVAAFVDGDTRALLRRPHLWVALAVGVLLLLPNVIWNLANDFATLRHTSENIAGSGMRISPNRFMEFVSAQAATLGPIVLGAWLVAAVRLPPAQRADRLMLAFSVPIFVLIGTWALVRVNHGNWAATAFIAVAVLGCAVLVRHAAWKWMAASLAIGIVVQAILPAADAVADRLTIPGYENRNPYHRTMGGRVLAGEIDRLAARLSAATVAVENREDVVALLYYLRRSDRAIRTWPQSAAPRDHFEATRPLASGAAEPILFVSECPQTGRPARQFASVERLAEFTLHKGSTRERNYVAYRLAGARGPIEPLGACSP